jgi:hypothetical protein
MVKVQGAWAGNGLRFLTREEALANAEALMGRWTLVEAYRAEYSEDPATDAWVDGKLRRITERLAPDRSPLPDRR